MGPIGPYIGPIGPHKGPIRALIGPYQAPFFALEFEMRSLSYVLHDLVFEIFGPLSRLYKNVIEVGVGDPFWVQSQR